MNILDQIIRGIHETRYEYAIRYAVDNVTVVIMISHVDFRNMLIDMRTYLYEYKDYDGKQEIRIHGCLVLRTPDLEEGDIRFLTERNK